MSNKRPYSGLLTVELFSRQESSLYCQDLFGYNSKNILFVVILSWFLGPVCIILRAILNSLGFLYNFSFEYLVLIVKLQRGSEVVAFKSCSFWPAWHKFAWKSSSRSPLTIKLKNKFWNNNKNLSNPRLKFIDGLYYKHNITLMTLFMNRLTFYSRK